MNGWIHEISSPRIHFRVESINVKRMTAVNGNGKNVVDVSKISLVASASVAFSLDVFD